MGRDRLALVTFAAKPTVRLPLTQHPDDRTAARALAPVTPYGSTDLVAAVDRVLDLVAEADTKNRHVLVLSDGRSRTRTIGPLIERAGKADVTVSVVATGAEPDAELLEPLAQRTGGRYYAIETMRSAATTFLDDIRKKRGELFVTDPRRIVPADDLPMALRETVGELAALTATGVNPVEARDAASTWLVTGEDEPALVTGPAGRGRTAAWPVDIFARANGDVLASPSTAEVWRNLVDRLAGGAPPPGLFVSVERTGADRAALRMRLYRKNDPVSTLRPTALITPAGGSTTMLPLHPTAPGRYEAMWRGAPAGAAEVAIVDESSGGAPLWRGRLAPWREEWRHWTIDRERLRRLASATGGAVIETPVQLRDVRALRREGRRSLRTAALVGLAMLVLSELAWAGLSRLR
jgi:hypothetical protein